MACYHKNSDYPVTINHYKQPPSHTGKLQHTEQITREIQYIQSIEPTCMKTNSFCALKTEADCSLTDGVHMRRQRSQRPALVLLDSLRRVKLWDVIVWIHGNQDVCNKCLGEEEKKKKMEGKFTQEKKSAGDKTWQRSTAATKAKLCFQFVVKGHEGIKTTAAKCILQTNHSV